VHNCAKYGKPDKQGRATGVQATITKNDVGGVTDPKVTPPGYQKYKKLNRGHLLGAQLGGSNTDPRNFVTMHRNANSPVMKSVEDAVRRAVDGGETVKYSVKAHYKGNDPLPVGITIRAKGNKGTDIHVSILNRPKP
jgi:hypothetical protein